MHDSHRCRAPRGRAGGYQPRRSSHRPGRTAGASSPGWSAPAPRRGTPRAAAACRRPGAAQRARGLLRQPDRRLAVPLAQPHALLRAVGDDGGANCETCHQVASFLATAPTGCTVRPSARYTSRFTITSRLRVGFGPAWISGIDAGLQARHVGRLVHHRVRVLACAARRSPWPPPRRRRAGTPGPRRKSSTALRIVAARPYCMVSRYREIRDDDHPRGLLRVDLGVQRGHDHRVTDREVLVPLVRVLPVEVRVPQAGAGQRDRREPVGARAVAVLDVVPLEEQRQRQARSSPRPRPGSGRTTTRCSPRPRAGRRG